MRLRCAGAGFTCLRGGVPQMRYDDREPSGVASSVRVLAQSESNIATVLDGGSMSSPPAQERPRLKRSDECGPCIPVWPLSKKSRAAVSNPQSGGFCKTHGGGEVPGNTPVLAPCPMQDKATTCGGGLLGRSRFHLQARVHRMQSAPPIFNRPIFHQHPRPKTRSVHIWYDTPERAL